MAPSGQCLQRSRGPIQGENLLPIYQLCYSTKSVEAFEVYIYICIYTHAFLYEPTSAETNKTNALPSFSFKSRTLVAGWG